MGNYIYSSLSDDGWMNLAVDQFFIENVKKDDIILYFYVNSNAVIIGRNQNAWKECNLEAMEKDGVQLVRRHTGGGAVYHDNGNLNFSFILHEINYDKERQFRVILNALASLGLQAQLSGRNDIIINEKKISGNAFGLAGNNRAHHGTLLVDSNLSRLSNYLNVSEAKIKSKGITSVRSRVCNLTDFVPGITVNQVKKAISDSFINEYGDAKEWNFTESDFNDVECRYKNQSSWEWRIGKSPQFDYEFDNRFSFGDMQIHLNVRNGIIESAKVCSDCLKIFLCEDIEKNLIGRWFKSEDIAKALMEIDEPETIELADYFTKIKI